MLYSDRLIEEVWEGMRDIPFDENKQGIECISKDYGPFDQGESKDSIWHWFDEHHSQGVFKLLKLG